MDIEEKEGWVHLGEKKSWGEASAFPYYFFMRRLLLLRRTPEHIRILNELELAVIRRGEKPAHNFYTFHFLRYIQSLILT